MPKGNKRDRWLTVHWSAHPQKEQSGSEKCQLQEELWYVLAILNSRLFENVLDIQQSHKIHNEKVKVTAGIKRNKL